MSGNQTKTRRIALAGLIYAKSDYELVRPYVAKAPRIERQS
jgi:hypothetical protein